MNTEELVNKIETLRQSWNQQTILTDQQRNAYYKALELNYDTLREYQQHKDILLQFLAERVNTLSAALPAQPAAAVVDSAAQPTTIEVIDDKVEKRKNNVPEN